ncbi:hypothetical protein [Spirosoma telluris]|uniref:hypothetical protein n=1 Tax=Spirosoma telluris TaxID=2183553 RepID=UPI002FC2DED8
MTKILGACFWATSFLLAIQLPAQPINPDILTKPWKAQWITGPGRPINRFTAASDLTLKEYGVVKFRKTITLTAKPTSLAGSPNFVSNRVYRAG